MKTRDQHGGRSGVALILVIGLLALMMVMGVTFSIYMRTGRVAAGNFLNDVRARNLLHVALNRAMNGVDTWVGDNLYPTNDAMMSGTSGGYVDVAVTPASFAHLPLGALAPQGVAVGSHPFLVTTNALSTNRVNWAGTVINLTGLSFGTITQIVAVGNAPPAPPEYRVYHTSLQGGATIWRDGDAYRFIQPGWLDLPAGTDEGRVGYVVVNASGLLDANYAGGAVREGGTNASEIQISELPEVVAANVGAFVAERQAAPYETIQELTAVGTNNGSLRSRPLFFATYSAFPTSAAVNVGGGVAGLKARKDAIIGAFTNSSFGNSTITPAQAGILFTNLIDYVDNDYKPGNMGDPLPAIVDGPFVEPVWMFNEICVSNRFTFTWTGSNYSLSGSFVIRPECIFPFIDGDASNCAFNMSVLFTNCLADGVPSAAYAPAINPYVRSASAIPPNPSYWAPVLPPVMIPAGTAVAAPPATIHLEAQVKAWITKGGDVVDACTSTPVTLVWDSARQASGSNYVFGSSADKECHDPRQNWDGSSGSQWASLSGNTIGQINRCTLVDLGKTIPVPPGTAARDGDTAMYTANKPLSTVGELGYLYFGRNWETIRLYKHGTPPQVFSQHNVLEFFTVESGSNPFLKGRVNVSTRHSDVLRAIFYDMPLDYPSGTSANRLAPPLLDTVVDMVLGLTGSTNMTSLAPLESLNWGSLLPSGTELDKEGFIRNSVGLLNTRQHLFVVLLYAQTTKTVPMMPDRSVVVGLRGVAEVWRDPIVSTNGFRTQSIRYFSVLSE